MSFNTIAEEERIFNKFSNCCKGLFDIDIKGIHLSKVDRYSAFDFESTIVYNGYKKKGKIEIRYTTLNIGDIENSFISSSKKSSEINSLDKHKIFISEHLDGLCIFDLNRAQWLKEGSSKLTKNVFFFNPETTPHLVLPISRNEEVSYDTLDRLKYYLIKKYGTIREARSVLMHMTNNT